jgi:hypothetical protein
MTDGTAGWFRDPNDPALARWHDGERWTEHTLVIADQPPGSEPPPPVEAAPTMASPAWESTGYEAPASSGPGRGGIPTWAKVVAPLAAIAIIAIAFLVASGGGDDGGTDRASTSGTEVGQLKDAVDAARRAGLTSAVSDSRAGAFIERICSAAKDTSEVSDLGDDLAALPASTPSELRQEINALGKGAEERCPSAMSDEPGLIDDLADEAVSAFSTTTTSPTILPDGADGGAVTGTDGGGTDSGSTTSGKGKTTTTKKGSTSTTAKPTTTTTLPQGKVGQRCPSDGAKAVTRSGGSLVCTHGGICLPTNSLTWQTRPCSPAQTVPTTDPNAPPPTIPPNLTTTTSGGGGGGP